MFFGPNVANDFQNLKIKLAIFFRKRRKLPHKIPFLMFLGPNLANVLP
jgi:hypothetical protein